MAEHTSEVTDKAIESIEKLIILEKDKIVTLEKMRRAFLIAKLAGIHPREVNGTVRLRHIKLAPSYGRSWERDRLRVEFAADDSAAQDAVNALNERAGAKTMEFEMKDVPMDLWPSDVKDAYDRYERQKRYRRANKV